MAPVVEIVYIPSSEKYRNDSNLLDDVCEYTKKAKGCLGVYHGLQHEDNKTLYLVVEAHYELINDKVIYPQLQEKLKPCVEGGSLHVLNMFHVPLNASPAPALNAKATSFAHIHKLGSGKSFSDIQPHLSQASAANGVNGAHGGAYGKLVERDEYVALIGWDTVELHLKAINDNSAFADAVNAVRGIASEITVKHVELKTYFEYEK
ncbi:uncharacterized protein PHACADRAFT_186581 [Phanerochaete carnosa HHB-10118-sp]|uniref:ABM domain-containing protein n=1 Tax=Phanerochaete carnosa (strain HHB-10118-sp) TaxID=650164 RepID=K5W024_PHACS|nr:uncharacterized protein PHACADRAFT_186581 [Phanerochaete carnosa HHB-10118-sp]EKM52430.1 hypothetical protein PHACADRAFT_186581 [Phanerochaete carnosa HHB-10118-sp]